MMKVPVIDVFAGPGGLGEGFASYLDNSGEPCFDIRLSIEKDPAAYQTLQLRSFFRSFQDNPPLEYYDYMRGRMDHDELLSISKFSRNRRRAEEETWCLELCEANHEQVKRRVRDTLGKTPQWVLIGGPPCQAYSVVGRSRMRSNHPRRFAQDERHFFYKEYLRIIIDHQPPVFVMENVRGLLSSTVGGEPIFEQILEDLSRPDNSSLRYRIFPFCTGGDLFGFRPEDFLIRSERFGIPQTRHRVILCGIREDISATPRFLAQQEMVTLTDALAGLPPLRSKLSREADSHTKWVAAMKDGSKAVRKRGGKSLLDVASRMARAARSAAKVSETGGIFVPVNGNAIPKSRSGKELHSWYWDARLHGIPNHESRSHMRSDVYRYLFAASFADVRGMTPKLRDFPAFLLPDHQNALEAADGGPFEDRFRVQLYNRPATTVVSHIAKDGHYYIHPDPKQCRSLTVREAARLQTFPDNYFFEGNRTAQYTQVGNAVPPRLAYQLAAIVRDVLRKAGAD